jgi:predicted RNA-binding protein (virulence factor B family)
LKNSIVKPITIHPDTALKIDLSLSNSKLEARADSTSFLTAELKDRYGNLVFDDNSTSLALEIPADYKHIIKV